MPPRVVLCVLVGLLVLLLCGCMWRVSRGVKEGFADATLTLPNAAPNAAPTAFTSTCPSLLPLHFPPSYSQDVSHDPLHELDNVRFQAQYVDALVPQMTEQNAPPCMNPYDTRVIKPNTTHARMHDPLVYNVNYDVPLNHDESTLARVPSALTDVSPAPNTLQGSALTDVSPAPSTPHGSRYAYPYAVAPATVHNTTTGERVQQGDNVSQVLPAPVEQLRASLPSRLNALTTTPTDAPPPPPYERLQSCVARVCTDARGARDYVWRDVYYRRGRTHGFQVEWTARNRNGNASLVYGKVVGNYLPSEPLGLHDDSVAAGAPNTLVFEQPTHAAFPTLATFQAERASKTYAERQLPVATRTPVVNDVPTLPMVGSPADTPRTCTSQLRFSNAPERCAARRDEFGRVKESGYTQQRPTAVPRWRR